MQGLKREALKLEVLPSPLEEVTASLLALAGDPTLTKAQTQALRHAIDLLTGDNLFVPDVEDRARKLQCGQGHPGSPFSLPLNAFVTDNFGTFLCLHCVVLAAL